jgi:hypothetical protein
MPDDFNPSDEYETDSWQEELKFVFGQSIRNRLLTNAPKRSVLASWACDARAVTAPSLRQLDDGTLPRIYTILDALNGLRRPCSGRAFADGAFVTH